MFGIHQHLTYGYKSKLEVKDRWILHRVKPNSMLPGFEAKKTVFTLKKISLGHFNYWRLDTKWLSHFNYKRKTLGCLCQDTDG